MHPPEVNASKQTAGVEGSENMLCGVKFQIQNVRKLKKTANYEDFTIVRGNGGAMITARVVLVASSPYLSSLCNGPMSHHQGYGIIGKIKIYNHEIANRFRKSFSRQSGGLRRGWEG